MKRLHPLLLALPLLLLVLLGALTWRSDWLKRHPPPSATDYLLRDAVSATTYVSITGQGSTWRRVTGLRDNQNFIVKDKSLLRELTQALRCTNQEASESPYHAESLITVAVPNHDAYSQQYSWS